MTGWTYRGAVEFSVLGPLEVRGASGPVEIRGVKERLLLARLVASAGRTVGVTDLIDGLWSDGPPRTAAKSLQTYVLRLRNTLEPGRAGAPTLLVTDPEGYRLAVDPRQVDAQRFARLVAAAEQARSQERLALLREALDLWRGRAYAGLDNAPALAAEATRLEQLRLGAVESRCAVEIELGRHRAVVPELEQLVAEHPLRERLWALLMTGLYRDGRQADALAAYDRARLVLADQLGIDPGPELRELHARVLGQDPTLGTVARGRPVPAALVAPATPMRGRDPELAVLRDQWHTAQLDGRRTVLVRGPLGSGARRLASALAEEVAAAGHPVVHVGAHSVDPQTPDPGARTLVVVDRGAVDNGHLSLPGLELRLAGPEAPDEDADVVVDLTPLEQEALRALVADRVPVGEVPEAVMRVGEQSRGWPGRAHAASMAWLRETASATVRTAVADADASRVSLHDARRRLAAGLLDLQQDETRPEAPHRCPWPGLEPYDVDDGAWYAGRERLVAELVARSAGASFLAVVGASGSGKSSAVRAGLLAALAGDQLPGSAGWRHLLMRPGVHPMRELAHRVLGAHQPDPGSILERLVRDDESDDRTVLVVDQFEEVWTACHDEGERAAFLDTLADLVADEAARVTVVVALRADYLDRLADHPRLAQLVGDNAVLVGAPTPDDVRRAVERPARRAGLQLDDGLADAIVEDAGDEPGLLPLLSTSLAQLWEVRDGHRLTFAGYVAVGGLRGAIGHLAEECYAGLDPSAQEVARTLLLRLTGPGEGTAVARRRVALDELAGLPRHDTRAVVERLAEARLLTLSEEHVEVAHEALFREWPRLRGWLAEDAAGRAVQRRLAVAAAEWQAEDREPHLLWRGTRLESGLEVAALRPEEITDVERDFLEAGREAADADRAEAERRAEEKARQNRRLTALLVGTALLLVVALVAGLVALVARDRAAASAAEAERAAVAADAKRLAASALSLEYPDLALLAAVESTRLEKSPETYGALLTLLSRQPDVVTRFRTPNRFLRNAASPDGRTVYVSENEPVLRALDAGTGEQLWVRDDLGGQVGRIAPSPDGTSLAVTVLAEGAKAGVEMLDPTDGQEIARISMSRARRFAGPGSSPWIWYRLDWTADGRLVFASDSHLFVADVRGRLRDAVPWPRPLFDHQTLVVWPDGHVSTALEEGGGSLVLDLARPDAPARTTKGRVLDVSPDGSRVLEVAEDDETGGSVRLLDARTLQPRSETWPVEGYVGEADFSPDGSRFVISVDEQVHVRDGGTAAPVEILLGHSGAVMSLVYAGPEHDLIWTAGRDGSAVAFDATGTRGLLGAVPTGDAPHSGTGSPTGAVIWTNYDPLAPNRAFLRRPGERRGRPLPLTGLEGCACQAASTALTADGTTALAGIQIFGPRAPVEDRGHVVVWDVATGEVRDRVATPWPVYGVAVTPDGRRAVLNGTGGWAVLDLTTLQLELGEAGPMEIPGTHGTALAEVAPDGRRAALLREGRVLVVDLETREVLVETELHANPDHALMSAAWAADGTQVAVGSSQGWFYVLDADTLAPAAPRRLITGGFVIDVEVAPDGRTAATIGSDGDVTLWDTRTWRPFGQPILDDRGWGLLWFGSDSSVLHVEYETGTRVEVGTRPAAWVEAACEAANRDLTDDEWAVIRPGLDPRPTCT